MPTAAKSPKHEFTLCFGDSVFPADSQAQEFIDQLYQLHTSKRRELKMLANHKYVSKYKKPGNIYAYQRQQLVLPFREYRKVSARDFDRLRGADFPGWDRDSTGELMSFIAKNKSNVVREWADKHCRHRFHVKPSTFTDENETYKMHSIIYFEREDDAVSCKLIFG